MANQYTKLFIENKEVDLFNNVDLPLNITKRVNNIEGQVQGDFSRASITIPATKNNILILKDTRRFFSFRIEVGGSPSFDGITKVRKGRIYSQSYGAIKQTYELNLLSGNSSWFQLLGETKLSELTDVNVPYNAAFILQGFLENAYQVVDFAFCLIKYKEWANLGSGGAATHYAPSIFESTPALHIKPLIIEAFNSIGYTVESEFLDSRLGSKLIIPTPIPEKMPKAYNDKYLNTEVSQSGTPFTFPVGNSSGNYPFDVIDITAPSNPTAYNNILFEYTAPLEGFYEVTIEFTFGAAPPPPFFFFITLEVNNVDITPRIGFAFSSLATGPQYPAAGTRLKATGVVKLNAGDIVNYRYVTNGGITVNSAKCTITGEAVKQPNLPIDFKFLLRDWRFLDMFQGIICMFNLVIEPNQDRRIVTIEPKDQWRNTYRPASLSELKEGFYKSTTKDYQPLIDWNKKGEFEFPNMPGRFDFKWDADNEATIQWIEQTNDFKIYESRYPMLNGADNSKAKPKTIPFFKKSIHVLDIETKFPDSNVIPQFPLIYPQSYIEDPTATSNTEEWGPRIFYHAGQRIGFEEIDGEIELYEFSGVPQKLPLTFMVNYGDDSGLDPNLGFDNKVLNGTLSTGLLQRFYLQEMARNDKGQIRKNYVKTNSIDNANFTFRIKGIIESQRYVVQKIEGFNPLTDAPTNFIFYLDVYPDANDVANIQNSLIEGVVSLLGT